MKALFRSRSASDEEIVSKLRAGDRHALDDFYLQQRKGFLNWAKGKSQLPETDLLDVYQNAFVVMYEQLLKPEFTLSSQLSTFLFGIGRNLLLKAHRTQLRNQDHEAAIRTELLQQKEAEPLNERAQRVRQVMQQVQEPCQSLLKLFYFEEKKLAEIATLMQYKNTNVVKSQKVRCLRKLQALMVKPSQP